jgi:hypothetical protein
MTRRPLLALLALALASACGTTVQGVSAGSPQATGDGLALEPTTAASAGPVAGGPVDGPLTPRAGATTPGAAQPTATAGVALPAGPKPVTSSKTPVEVGFFVTKDLGPLTKALGVDGLATGDGKKQAEASLKLLNARGGLAGHPVKAVIFEYDATGNNAGQQQAACSLFFEDHKVRAVTSILTLDVLQACTAKAGVPFVSSGNRSTSAANLARYPLTATPPMITLDRFVPVWIASLKEQGYFPAGARVGLIYNEDPDFSAVPKQVETALQNIGQALVDKQPMPGTDDTSKVTAATSAGKNAALRFAAARIDRVLAVDKSGQALAYFGLAAQGQSYYPVYGLSSLELPNSQRTVLSKRSMQGARGIGWSPGLDLPVRNQTALSATFTACINAMKQAGEDMSSQSTRFSALSICDSALLLAAAWTDNTLQGRTFYSGLRALGSRYASALTFGTDFSRHPDGASRYRTLAFDDACDCFTYRSPFRTVS